MSLSTEFDNIYGNFVKKINNIDNTSIDTNNSSNNNIIINNPIIVNSPLEDSDKDDASGVHYNSDDKKCVIITDDVINDVVNVFDDDSMYDVVIVFVHDDVIEKNEIFQKNIRADTIHMDICILLDLSLVLKLFRETKV